jgi:hypothetical protein
MKKLLDGERALTGWRKSAMSGWRKRSTDWIKEEKY